MKLAETTLALRTAERELKDASRKLLILQTIRDILMVNRPSPMRSSVIETLEAALTNDRERNISNAVIDLIALATATDDSDAEEHYRNIARRLACRA